MTTYSKSDFNLHNTVLGAPLWCTDNPENADPEKLYRMLQSHYKIRNTAFNQLLTLNPTVNIDFINNFYSYFYVDDSCLCKGIFGDRKYPGFKTGKKPIAAGAVGKVYNIEYRSGETVNTMILKSIKPSTIYSYMSLRVFDVTQLNKIINPSIRANTWTTTDNRKVFLAAGGTDNFSNQTCMHMILNAILGDSNNYVKQYDAFYCFDPDQRSTTYKAVGYNITEKATLGDLGEFLFENPPDTAMINDILKQLFTPLRLLKSDLYGFNHSDLKTKNVFVSKKGGRIVYQLADFDKSSIFWRGVRFYNRTFDYQLVNFPPRVAGTEYYYQFSGYVTNYTQTLNPYIMHNPEGFYMSYDIYTFMFSMMLEPTVWDYYQQHQNPDNVFYRAWTSLWFEDDMAKIMNYISTTHRQYANERDPVLKKDLLRKMRKISVMNAVLIKLNVKLKLYIQGFWDALGIPKVNVSADIGFFDKKLAISKDGHICLDGCNKTGKFGYKYCDTNKYSKKGQLYKWDYC